MKINVDNFQKYCLETAELYIENFHWYCMPQSPHKILLHGPSIIKNFHLPIGMLSEEALESRNKDFKSYRKSFTRKSSRTKTNEDLMIRLLCSYDPLIRSFRKSTSRSSNIEDLPGEARDLIDDVNIS